ncbi:MAG TPA: preprotein translocase subunit SecE [Candidatus Cloacimonadota bacterium]|nr:preprotein translocase subunit SecE [Candidatus Cloacimonadota bacterium]
MSFFKSVQGELKFVSWPSKDDIKEGTTVVILMSALVAIFLSLVDAGFGFLIKNLLLG